MFTSASKEVPSFAFLGIAMGTEVQRYVIFIFSSVFNKNSMKGGVLAVCAQSQNRVIRKLDETLHLSH